MVATASRREQRLSSESLTGFHRAIFGSLFAEWEGAGRFRQDHEPTEFQVPIRRGGRWMWTRVHGADAARIRDELGILVADWNAWSEAESRTVEPREALLAVAKLYTGILRVHPFVDGNHRAAYAMLARVLWSLNMPLVAFRTAVSMRDHDRAAAPALLPTRDAQPFADFLGTRMSAAT